MLQTLSRAGQVLDLFSAEQREWGASAVGRELGVAKSQAHELLVSLCDIGLLQRMRPGRYRLGWRIVALNSVLWHTSPFGREAAALMRTLAARWGETVQLGAWAGDGAVCLAGWKGRRALAVAPAPVGMGLPAHCTGLGKVLLASRPPAEVSGLLSRTGLERMTNRTIASPEDLHEELAGVRRRGFAYEDQEHAPGTCSVAAPIVHAHGEVLAALSMSVPPYRWRQGRDQYTRVTVATASRISRVDSETLAIGD